MYKIETENPYEDFCKSKELFDFGSYSKVPNYYDNSNNFVVGKMKDRTCGVPIKGLLELKAKMYNKIHNKLYNKSHS